MLLASQTRGTVIQGAWAMYAAANKIAVAAREDTGASELRDAASTAGLVDESDVHGPVICSGKAFAPWTFIQNVMSGAQVRISTIRRPMAYPTTFLTSSSPTPLTPPLLRLSYTSTCKRRLGLPTRSCTRRAQASSTNRSSFSSSCSQRFPSQVRGGSPDICTTCFRFGFPRPFCRRPDHPPEPVRRAQTARLPPSAPTQAAANGAALPRAAGALSSAIMLSCFSF